MPKVRLSIAGMEDPGIPQLNLYLKATQYGVSLMVETTFGSEDYLVSVTTNGTLIRHCAVSASGIETDEGGRISEETDEAY